MRKSTDKMHGRVFFGLWPDESTRAALASITRRLPLPAGARRVPDYNLHLTLHFIGSVRHDDLDCMRRQARRVDANPFTLVIDHHGRFAKARVGWLGCSVAPAGLLALQRALGRRLQDCGYESEARAYNPHVTFARKLGAMPDMPGFESLRWPVENFALIESQPAADGVKYRVMETYPLR